MTKSLTLALLAVSLVAAPAAAHHGWSSYDSDNAITLTGKITEASYTYPHGTIMLETPGKRPGWQCWRPLRACRPADCRVRT